MSFSLPPSLQKERHPVEEEVAFARTLSPEERLRLVSLACRASLKVLQLHAQRDKILQMRDPLPASTVAALKRLHNKK